MRGQGAALLAAADGRWLMAASKWRPGPEEPHLLSWVGSLDNLTSCSPPAPARLGHHGGLYTPKL